MFQIRKACLEDIEFITGLVNHPRNLNILLSLTKELLIDQIRDYMVIELIQENDRNIPLGCASLHVYTSSLAEIRSLNILPEYTGNGYGRALVEGCLTEAAQIHVKRVFVLTKTCGFFEKLGFKVVTMETLPEKVYKDCLKCNRFHRCDETAMVKELLVTEDPPVVEILDMLPE